MTPSTRNRTIALAGVFQSAELVHQLAWEGQVDETSFATCIGSIFTLEAEDIDTVFGGVAALAPGLRMLVQQLGGESKNNMEITRYTVNLLYLARRLTKHADFGERVREGIVAAQRQQSYFSTTHSNTIATLADLYRQTISQLGPRIIVQGEQNYLGNPETAAQIRALLLAGVRAAVLWSQSGGNRWRLIFGRGKLVHEGHALLSGA